MRRSRGAALFSSATMSPTKRCSGSSLILAGWQCRWAGTAWAWRIISMNRARCGSGSRVSSRTRLQRNDDQRLESSFARPMAPDTATHTFSGHVAQVPHGGGGVPCRAARFWFHFVERVTGNHIDEWPLIYERKNQEGTTL